MSQVNKNCPQCGAPVNFRWSQAVQTTCTFCHSILVRTDVDLQKVGQTSDFSADPSPIQIGTEGIIDQKAFVVIGRILYEYDDGGWNEWHLVYNNGESGWLSDAQLQYAVSRITNWPNPFKGTASRGEVFRIENVDYTLTTMTEANYKGVEGELPFQFWDKTRCRFVDLRGPEGEFVTVDYTDGKPVLYAGRFVEYSDLRLKNVKLYDGWTA